MRIVLAADWSDETFAAVQAIGHLYAPQELTFVHAVDMAPFESPFFAPNIGKEAYKDYRDAMVESGEQLLEQTAALAPPGVKSVRCLCELGSPADVILDTARASSTDLLVMGTRSRGRLAELVLGSVSHRVLLHAPCSTLIVKRPLQSVNRVLVAVEGSDDAAQIGKWLRTNPFTKPVELTVLHVVPIPQFHEPGAELSFAPWIEEAETAAKRFLEGVRAELEGPHYTVRTDLLTGFPAQAIAEKADKFDLVIVGSHGRTGMGRFLLGSVSHAVVHRVGCPILIVRAVLDTSR